MLSILLVEDNKENQLLASWIIEDAGYALDIADSAEAGLQQMSLKHYDLVLMDISLPGMSGKDAVRLIRKNPKLKHIPVIAVTAHSAQTELNEINQCGFSAVQFKPLDENLLLQAIKQATAS
ncbi:response regulator [Dasania sp. GY-MA-18]|uniref:Response regulator n=1 Tax=Dasania phycosphaerae TaxID=2950436 RepID=A0A9J6RKN3_9GAMM|nr:MULTISPECIES: response regulator [Dasania]MCR8922356.1 response regulator [Dasania sp. GY-MA-18]MCZ0864784.1 response regulator [Dasania phycosphaerae]MCZ0868512.1 response regulator [Dasania phycosphaerae]